MSDQSGIEWTDATWNPTRGCSRVSEGCRNCYAETMAARFSGPGAPYQGLTRGGKWTGKIALDDAALAKPLHWKKPRKIFVNSMSDLFHEGVPEAFVDRVFAVMALCPQHTFQVLTKRPERMRAYLGSEFRSPGFETPRRVNHAMGEWREAFPSHRGWADIVDGWAWPLPNVWLGVSVEDQGTADARIPELLRTPAAVRFVSYEPALGPVDFEPWLNIGTRIQDFSTAYLNWIICGGESGPGARPCDIQWLLSVVVQCQEAGVPCFVKQLGAKVISRNDQVSEWLDEAGISLDDVDTSGVQMQGDPVRVRLRDAKGGDPTEWPTDLRVREFPKAGAVTA